MNQKKSSDKLDKIAWYVDFFGYLLGMLILIVLAVSLIAIVLYFGKVFMDNYGIIITGPCLGIKGTWDMLQVSIKNESFVFLSTILALGVISIFAGILIFIGSIIITFIGLPIFIVLKMIYTCFVGLRSKMHFHIALRKYKKEGSKKKKEKENYENTYHNYRTNSEQQNEHYENAYRNYRTNSEQQYETNDEANFNDSYEEELYKELYYEKQLFGVWGQKTFTEKELKKRWHELVKKYHPDNGGDASVVQTINEAYERLLKYAEK